MASIAKSLELINSNLSAYVDKSPYNPNSILIQTLNAIAFYYNDREKPFIYKIVDFYRKAIIGKSDQEVDQEKTEKKFNKLVAEYVRTNKIINSKFTKDLIENPIVKFYASLRTLKDPRYNSLLKRINLFDPKDRILNLQYGLHYRNPKRDGLEAYGGAYDPQKMAKVSHFAVQLVVNRTLFIALFNALIKPIFPSIFKYCSAGYLENDEYKLDEKLDLENSTNPFISYHTLIDFLLSAMDYEFNVVECHMPDDDIKEYINQVTDNEIKILNLLKEHLTCSQTINRIDNILIKKYLVKNDLEHAKEIFNKNYKDDQYTISDLCSSILIAHMENNLSLIEKFAKDKLASLKNNTIEELYPLHPAINLLVDKYLDINESSTELNAFTITLNLYSSYKYESLVITPNAQHSYYLSTILNKDQIENICTQKTLDEAQEYLTSLMNSEKYTSIGTELLFNFIKFLPLYHTVYCDYDGDKRFDPYHVAEYSYSIYNCISELIYPKAKENLLNHNYHDFLHKFKSTLKDYIDVMIKTDIDHNASLEKIEFELTE